MYTSLKKNALKALFADKKISLHIFLTYMFEIAVLVLSDMFFDQSIFWKLILFCSLYLISTGEYNVFMKLAEHRKITEDDYFKLFSDKEYVTLFKEAGRSCCFTIIPIAALLIFFKIFLLLLPDLVLGKSSGLVFLCIIIMLISGIFFVVYTAKYLFVPYILADRFNSLSEGSRKEDGDVYAVNKRMVEYDTFKLIKYILSFSGWFILSVVTLGIGFIFLIPYFNQATAILYVEKREQYNYMFEGV